MSRWDILLVLTLISSSCSDLIAVSEDGAQFYAAGADVAFP